MNIALHLVSAASGYALKRDADCVKLPVQVLSPF